MGGSEHSGGGRRIANAGRPAAASGDLHRDKPLRLEPPRGQRRRHRRLLLYPRHPCPRTKTEPGEALRRPRTRRLPLYSAPPPCKASDECHGPGTQAPPPNQHRTLTGAAATPKPTKQAGCKAGFLASTAGASRSTASPNAVARPIDMAEPRLSTADGQGAESRESQDASPWLCGGAVSALAAAAPHSPSERINPSPPPPRPPRPGATRTLEHPSTSRTPGEPGDRQERDLQRPAGHLRKPLRDRPLHLVDFALDQCPSNSQAGLITVYAKYEGNPDNLLGTAPIFDLEPQSDQTALFAFIVPTLDIPINIPVAVRTAGDYGLRFTVQDITQLTPLAGADLTFWGFPAEGASHECRTFPQRQPRAILGLPRTGQHELPGRAGPGQHRRAPADRQPDHMYRQAADHEPRSPDLSGPRTPLAQRIRLPAKRPGVTSRSSTRSSTQARRRPKPTRPPASMSS